MEARPKLVYFLSSLLLAFALLYAADWSIAVAPFPTLTLGLGGSAVFLFLAFVPGVLAIVYHLVTVTQRRQQNIVIVNEYYKWRNGRTSAQREHQKAIDRGDDPLKDYGPVSANTATLLLTAVFLFVAIVASDPAWRGKPLQGIVYAGLGAYVSILYYMVGRLYASALSSRFLMSSAVGSASAVVMGWFFASTGFGVLEISAGSFALETVLFLTGLFHKWAFDALRRRARKLFGQAEPETAEMPLNAVEGVDDVHADLLSEYGVTTVQGLATAEPGELCDRTLLPLDRLADWIDQAILLVHLKKNIMHARALDIRGANDIVKIYKSAQANPSGSMATLLDEVAKRCDVPRGAIDAMAERMRDDYQVGLVHALRQGEALTPQLSTVVGQVVHELKTNYTFIGGQPPTQVKLDIQSK